MKYTIFTLLFLLYLVPSEAQITFNNPGFNDAPGQESRIPTGWKSCGGSPDIQPNAWGVVQPAFEGSSYAGFHTDGGFRKESIESPISTHLIKDLPYEFTFQMVIAELRPGTWSQISNQGNNPAFIEIRGSTTSCGEQELLWTSRVVQPGTGWNFLKVKFTPSKEYEFISFHPQRPQGAEQPAYIGIDDISPITPSADSLLCNCCSEDSQHTFQDQLTGPLSNFFQSPWKREYGNPQYVIEGFSDPISIELPKPNNGSRGSAVDYSTSGFVGEDLLFKKGNEYCISYSYKVGEGGLRDNQGKIKLRGTNDSQSDDSCSGNCEVIDISPTINRSDGWQTHQFLWTATSDYFQLIFSTDISPVENTTPSMLFDNVCIAQFQQCSSSKESFCNLVDLGWEIKIAGCDVKVETNQFDPCHWMNSESPDWGDGSPLVTGEFPANGCWTHTYAPANLLINGGIKTLAIRSNNFTQVDASRVEGWETDQPNNKIEFWSSGYQGVVSASGTSHIELNVNEPTTIWQTFSSDPGSQITWEFEHRARGNGTEQVEVMIGTIGSLTSQGIFNATAGVWTKHFGTYNVPINQSSTTIAIKSLTPGNGGNFIDEVKVHGSSSTYVICATILEGNNNAGGCRSKILCDTIVLDHCPPLSNCDPDVDPCDLLFTNLGEDVINTDQCCFIGSINNQYCDSLITGITVRVDAPASIAQIESLNDWSINQLNPHLVVLWPPEGTVPIGSSEIFRMCNIPGGTSFNIDVSWLILDNNGEIQELCKESFQQECGGGSPGCIEIVQDTIDCQNNSYCFQVRNNTTPEILVKAVEFVQFSPTNAALIPDIHSVQPLSSGNISEWVCVDYNIPVGNELCFRLIGHQADVPAGERPMWCCADTTIFCIEVPDICSDPLTDFCLENISYNNGMTPNNGDDINQYFEIRGLQPECGEICLTIFNRWGQEVWRGNNYNNNWSGTNMNGEDLAIGVYYALVQFKDLLNQPTIKTFIDIDR